MIGKTLANRYLIERLIGEGGMGAVYAARQLGLDREVAVKVLRKDVAASAVQVERFRREALAAARLDHPNIVKVFDFGREDDGSAYLVMELLTGPSLERWLAENPRPDAAFVASIFAPVAAAVDALHRAGIIHRDIKPANIALPDPTDADDVVKLIDLGIVRFSEAVRGDLTGGMIIGTAEYIAPEVATGAAASSRSDLYALGITAFEALVGFPPFTGDSDREILLGHIRNEPPRASRARRGLSSAADDVFARILAKDPADRFGTAGEFSTALIAAVAVTPITAPRPSPRSVLVVSDSEALRSRVRDPLRAFGYVVTETSDAFDALLKLGGERFDVVIADATLPGLDGPGLLRLAAEKGVRTPGILVASEEEAFLSSDATAAAVLPASFDPGALFAAISEAIAAEGDEEI